MIFGEFYETSAEKNRFMMQTVGFIFYVRGIRFCIIASLIGG